MAGYNGYSMSNNAVRAYQNGEKPLSKWTKGAILEEIRSQEIKMTCSTELFTKLPIAVMREKFLCQSSWHHTSSHFNKTDFYSLDQDELEELTDNKIRQLIAETKKTKEMEKQSEPQEERWQCTFLEWSGTRKYPKATEVTEVGTVKGNWFYREDGTKKSTLATGFQFIKKLPEQEQQKKAELSNEDVRYLQKLIEIIYQKEGTDGTDFEDYRDAIMELAEEKGTASIIAKLKSREKLLDQEMEQPDIEMDF